MTTKELYKLYQEHPCITTDSRDCPKGSIFLALKGDKFNGNEFALQALQQGCAYAIVDEAPLSSPLGGKADSLAGNDSSPKGEVRRGLPAIAVSGPFGAVKEQSSGLYAQHMAERGFLTIAFDPSFTGESGGEPRRMASPDINTEDFLAAVDFLSVQDNVDAEKIGIIGICGFGGMAVNAAAIDPRIKATVASTMYDMSKVNVEGYFKSEDTKEQRMEKRKAIAQQRTEDFKSGTYKRAGGVIDPLPEDAPFFVKDYYDYYKTPRGYHERSGNSTDGWNVIGCQSFLNQPLLAWVSK